MFKKIIKSLIPSKYRYFISLIQIAAGVYRQDCFGQEGEDLLLAKHFGDRKNGFYVDVGAHHPARFSNTYIFYKRGWHGVNIDAMPGSMKLFNIIRSRDINIETPISDKVESLTYYAFDEPALNGFSKELSVARSDTKRFKILYTKDLQTQPLASVLDRHLPPNQKIDFMTVDVEGHDLQVLRSNDWQKYRPELVLAEMLGSRLKDETQDPVYLFMQSVGYRLFAKTYSTAFFKDVSACSQPSVKRA